MKKVFLGLSIILAVIMVINAQSVTAQTSIDVTWDDNCLGTASSQYQISYDVSNVCRHIGIDYELQTLPLTADGTTFIIDDFCTISTVHPCFRLTITLKKVSGSGVVLCEETFVGYYNCMQFEALTDIHLILD